jgi:arginase
MAYIDMLGVPMDLGASRRGVDMGPSALRLARLGDQLRNLGHTLEDHGNLSVPVAESVPMGSGDARYLEAIALVCGALATAVCGFPRGHTPLVLGGDHALSLGSVIGSQQRVRSEYGPGQELGVLWIDAHADLNTPTTSPTGNVHGMPLAHLLGVGDARLTRLLRGGPLPPENVVLIGLRSVDTHERAWLGELSTRTFSMSDIDRHGIARVMQDALAALAHTRSLHVSFDADVLDPDVAPGVGTAVRGGLHYREAHLLMELLSEHGRIGSVDLVEVNPILDEGNRTAGLMVELAASLFGRRIL